MSLFACQDEVKVITTCPPTGSKILLFDVTGQPTGMALMDVRTFVCCVINQMFGVGIKTFKGSDMVGTVYTNTGLVGNFLVYAWGIPNLLIPIQQWDYVRNGSGDVIGVQILINFGDDDMFTIFPNPTCNSTPIGQLPEGIQFKQAIFSGDGFNTTFIIPHGLGQIPYYDVQPVGNDASGVYTTTADSTYIYVNYNVAPIIGTDNVILNWAANIPST